MIKSHTSKRIRASHSVCAEPWWHPRRKGVLRLFLTSRRRVEHSGVLLQRGCKGHVLLRAGEHGGGGVTNTFTINFSGNYLCLFPPLEQAGSWPSAVAEIGGCQTLNLCGNTLVSGGFGVWYEENCANALVLNNDFSGVTHCGIGYMWTENSLPNAQIYGNKLGQGVTFHAKPQLYNGFGWFLKQNQYLNGSTTVFPPFLDPVSSAAHVSN